AIGYALFEIPGGWMGDRFGPRIILTRIVLWWSAFTALTGAVSSYPLLVLTRLMFGPVRQAPFRIPAWPSRAGFRWESGDAPSAFFRWRCRPVELLVRFSSFRFRHTTDGERPFTFSLW